MSEEKKNGNVLNLDLSETARTKIWVNGDCTKVLELNLTDLGVIARAKDAQVKLDALQEKATKLASSDVPDDIDTPEDEKKFDEAIELFRDIDKEMREIVDYVFDFPVCNICCDGGSMYDPVKGQYRYEYILDKLMALYNVNWAKESKLIRDRMKSHTAKYTKSTNSRKKR